MVQNVGYLPFGELNSGNSGYTTHMFTGDERDGETGLDETWFRKYSSNLGRWMTPDPAGLAAVDATNPQSWNRYAYVFNNPLAWVDPLGLCGGAGNYPDLPCPSGGTITVTASAPDEPFADAPTGDTLWPSMFGAGMGGADDINAEALIFARNHGGGGGGLKPSLPPAQLKRCTAAQAKVASLKQQLRAASPNQLFEANLKEVGYGALIGCGAAAVGVTFGTDGLGAPFAPGACAVGAVGGAMTAEGVFLLSNAGGIWQAESTGVQLAIAEGQAAAACQP